MSRWGPQAPGEGWEGVTLTTSGGSACMSSKGVSKALESMFNTTTSSRALSRTLCKGGRMLSQSLRIPPWRGRGSLPPRHLLTSARLACTPMR